jgi:hypothetical protein
MIKIPNDYKNIQRLAGGRITCLRCTAMSKRTRLQCGRPAMKVSKTQKCNFHGGKSTGPKTTQGRQRISKANLVHGDETIQKRVERQKMALWFKQVEDVMHVLDMTTGGRIRGPKPSGYIPIRTFDDVLQWVLDNPVHPNKGV